MSVDWPSAIETAAIILTTAIAIYAISKIVFSAYFNARLNYAEKLAEKMKEIKDGEEV